MNCPRCHSENIIKNGSIHNGKQKYECKECKRQFVENPENKIISSEIKILIDKLLCEKIPLAGICRVTGISEPWLQNYVYKKYESVPKQVNVSNKKKGRLTVQCDEMWSFVGNKSNKQWVRLAIDAETKENVNIELAWNVTIAFDSPLVDDKSVLIQLKSLDLTQDYKVKLQVDGNILLDDNNNEIELLLLENEKLNEYLSRLDRMEQKVRAGN